MANQTEKLKIAPEASYEKHQFDALEQTVARLAFLTEVSRRLSFCLTDQEVFQQLTNLLVPDFADNAAISILKENGTIERVAITHANHEKADQLRVLLTKYLPSLDDNFGTGHVIRTSKPEYDREFDSHAEEQRRRIRYPELFEIIRRTGVRSYICVPCEAHQKILGALWLSTSDSNRRLEPEDLQLAQEVASRAALALYNQQRYNNATKAIEILRIERDVRETYIAQVRHDVLSVLTTASLSAQLLERSKATEEVNARLTQRIKQSIEKAADILRKTKLNSDSS
ncbi:MAG: GAF domain-containing protein [Bdellovibrionia bacterium]